MLIKPQNTDSSHSSRSSEDSFFKSRVQTKLAVGQPGDRYEVEADNTADKVVSRLKEPKPSGAEKPAFFSPKHAVQTKKQGTIQQKEEGGEDQEIQEKLPAEQARPLTESITPLVQTSLLSEESVQEKCAACEAEEQKQPVQTKCAECEAKEKEAKEGGQPVQQKCDKCAAEEEKTVQHKKNGSSGATDISQQLSASKGGGSPMDKNTQSEMSSGFGADFSSVRVHTDSNAVQMNKSLGSHAFTNGNDVYFNSGKYDPSSEGGKHLLAHELTHTVQQGASGKSIAKKEDGDKEEITPLQSKSTTETIQKADDPCAKTEEKEKDKTEKKEESKAEKDCKARYIPAEDPGDREEPDEEEQPKDIEAKPEMGAEERQKGAPPVDGEPKKAEASAENPLEICKKREEKQAQTGKGSNTEKVNTKPDSGGPKEEKAAPAKAEAGKDAPQADTESKNAGKKKGKENKGLADATQQAGKKGNSPVPQGELSSPVQVAERDLNLAMTASTMAGVRGTQAHIQALGSTPLQFNANADSSVAAANAMANNFINSKSAKAVALIDQGLASVDGIRLDTALKRQELENEIAGKKQRSKAFFRQKAAQALQSANKTKMAMNQQHLMTVMQIEMKALTDTKLLRDAFKKMSADISLKYLSQVISVNETYSKSYDRHIQIGKQQGVKAKQMGRTMAADYRTANVDGASAKDKQLVRNQEKDGFWDGYLTYNRYMARADSAIETGKQYQEGMETQAKEKADKLMCEKTAQLAITQEISKQGIQNLQCALDDAIDAIQLRKTAAIGQANAAKEEFTKNIDAALKGTLNELKEKQVAQELVINDFGARQIVALENGSLQAQIGLLKGLQGLVDDLKNQLEGFAATVNGMDAPDPIDYEQQLLAVDAQFEAGLQATSSGITTAIAGANELVNNNFSMARNIIDGVYDQGITDGQLIFATYDELIKGIDAKRLEFFAQHLQTTIQGLQTEYDQGSTRMNSVVVMIGLAYEHLLNGLKDNVKASEDGLLEGMTKTINQDLKATICSQAEAAAEEVQPWWKSVLKVLLVILVIVIVIALTIVTAGAFAAVGAAIAGAGTLGATLIAGALAGAVMGALSSVLITVGMNVINLAGTGKLTWSAAFEGALDAAIQGAIAGAIGGMAGPLVGVFSKGVGVLGKVLIEEGIEIAFDVLGGVIGDLVLHGEVKDWGNILFGAFVARGIANGVKIVPKIKTKITGAKGGSVDVNTSGTKTKTQVDADTGATPKASADSGTAPKTNAEGGNVPKTQDSGVSGGKKNKPVSEGQQQAKKLGYPEAPEGYHWRKGPNGEPTLAKNPGTKGGKLKYDPETGQFKNADAVSAPKKKLGDETDLELTRTKQTLSDQEFDLEMGAVNKRLPGRKIEMEDGGVKYTREVELPNGHKWRQRADGGWCRFSKKTCYGFDKTRNRIRKNNASNRGGELGFSKTETQDLRKAVTSRKKVESDQLVERHLGTTSHQVPKELMARVINDPQVVLTAKNGNLIFFKGGTVVITSSKNIADVKTAFGKGGFIPSRHAGPGKLYPAGSTGNPEPMVILKDFIKQQAASGNPVVRIWP